MPTKGKNIVKYNAGEQSLKVANVIYFDLETLQRKQQSAQNNPIQSYTETKTIQEAGGYSLALETTYDKRTHKFYRGKDCMEQFGNDLMTLAMKVINTDKKEMTPRTNRQENIMIHVNIAISAERNFVVMKMIKNTANTVK